MAAAREGDRKSERDEKMEEDTELEQERMEAETSGERAANQ